MDALVFGGGHDDCDAGAVTERGVNRKAPTMVSNDSVDDREPEAAPARSCVSSANELLRHAARGGFSTTAAEPQA